MHKYKKAFCYRITFVLHTWINKILLESLHIVFKSIFFSLSPLQIYSDCWGTAVTYIFTVAAILYIWFHLRIIIFQLRIRHHKRFKQLVYMISNKICGLSISHVQFRMDEGKKRLSSIYDCDVIQTAYKYFLGNLNPLSLELLKTLLYLEWR